jgi:hypothetical protein
MGEKFNFDYKKEICEKIPLNRFGEVSDIINIMDYLIEKNKYITGSNININGGVI